MYPDLCKYALVRLKNKKPELETILASQDRFIDETFYGRHMVYWESYSPQVQVNALSWLFSNNDVSWGRLIEVY